MSPLNSLSPDLRAALALLLRQHKRHAEVAAMLAMPERAVHDRAHAALALLAPAQARALSPEQREQVGEYLLGQQTGAQQRETRAYLERDPAARAWAQALVRELEPLASGPLPAIAAPAEDGREPLASSRAGGAIVLGAIAAVVVIAILLIVGVGGGGKAHTASNPSASSTGASGGHPGTTATGAGNPGSNGASTTSTGAAAHTTRSKALPLTAPDPTTSKAVGLAYVFTQSGRRAFYLLAKELPSLPSGTFYAVWLEDASGAPDYPLGSLPTASSDGLVEGGGPLPSSAGEYRRIAVTTETSHTPTTPGPTVLRGPFTLH